MKKSLTKMDFVAILTIVIIYFASRLTNLLALPIFSDEGIYIRWARVAANDPSWRFISLTDGKQPLQTWGTIPFIKMFPDELLMAGRLFSVATGLLALIGIGLLCGYLWGKRGALIGTILYIVTPFFLFYDRMALVDSGVNAAFIWILFLSLVLSRYRRLDIAMIFGVVAGIGLLAKSSVALFLALSTFGILITMEHDHIKERILFSTTYLKRYFLKNRCKIASYYGLLMIVFFIGISLYLVQKFFSPFFHYIAEKNLTFIQSPKEWLEAPFSLVANNVRYVTLYVAWESGWIPVVFAIAGFFVLIRKRLFLALYLAIWTLVPFLLIINFNKVIFPRYLIFFPTLLTIYTVAFITSIRDKKVLLVSVVTSVLILSGLSYPILFNVVSISLPPVDRGQYIEGQTAVWGAYDLMNIIRDDVASSSKPAIVLAEGNFGLIADVLEVMKKPTDKINIEGYWPLDEKHITAKIPETNQNHVYIVFSHRRDFPVHWRKMMDEVAVFDKPGDDPSAVYLYKLKSKEL